MNQFNELLDKDEAREYYDRLDIPQEVCILLNGTMADIGIGGFYG